MLCQSTMLVDVLDVKILKPIGHSEIVQGTGASFKFQPFGKLTQPHERSH